MSNLLRGGKSPADESVHKSERQTNSCVSSAPLMKQIKALSEYKGEQKNVAAINCFYMGIASGVIVFTSCAHMHLLHRVNNLIK